MKTGPIEKSTVATQVSQELRRRIIEGVYQGGMRLRQEEIATELGVSRSPIREALRQLEAEGLILNISQKGVRVAPILAEEVSELFELRVLLEPHLLALAIPNFEASDFAAAERSIAKMQDVDTAYWGQANWQFHVDLYRPAKRPTIMRQLERIHETIDRYLRMQVTITRGRDRAHAEHLNILEACRSRDVALAVALLKSHILQAAHASRPEQS